MLKYIIIFIIFYSTFLNAGIGTLRIIADFGNRDNISIKNCTASKIDDFIFLNDNPNDTSRDLILNRPGFTTLHLCAPDLLNSNENNIKYKDFKPTLILFNDQGIKGVPSLYNKKLVTSSSINIIILTYLFQNMDNQNGVLSLKELYKQLSKFNINNFYLAIDYDSYEALNDNTKLNDFFEYLDNIPKKIKDDDLSEKVFTNKIKQLKDLYKFALELYGKVYDQYQRLYTKSYIDIWQSGYTKEYFCQIDNNNNFIASKTVSTQTVQECYNCIKSGDLTVDCSSKCNNIIGYKACKTQTNNLKTLNECFYENCIGSLNNNSATEPLADDVDNWIYQIKYGEKSEALSTVAENYYDFKHIPYTNIKEGIVKLDDGSINEEETKKNRNSICREKITSNLAETFNFYSNKLSYKNYQEDLTFNLEEYPTLKNFYSIIMDIHSIFLTNDIQNLINDLVNTECISGNFNNNVDDKGNHLNYNANKKLINYVDVLKFNGTSFYEYSNKMFALNMLGNFLPKTINPTNTSTVGTITNVDNKIAPGGGGLDTSENFKIDLEDNSQCSADESLLILYYDDLSKNIQDPATLNSYLNKKITGNENSGFFDIKNYQLYLGCYKEGYITKFVGKYKHSPLNKNLLLSCYSKWLNEPSESTGEDEASNTSAVCLDYFYKNLTKNELENIFNKFDDPNNDLVVFASIVHFNIFNSEDKFDTKLNGSPEIDKDTTIFKNIIPTISYNSMNIEDYTLKETVCEKISDYEIVEVKDENGTTVKDENGEPITQIIKGEYECYNNVSNQDLYNYQHQYNYEVQDYIMMLNAYSPIKLSDISSFTLSQKNSLSINNEYKAFSTKVSKNEIKDCPIIYLDPESVNEDTYIKDNRYCLGNGKHYSDYNTESKYYIKLKFTDYITQMISFANNNGILMKEPITEENFYTGKFPADTAFLFKPEFENNDNDIYLYEIDHKDKKDIAGYINGTGNYNNVITKELELNKEDENIDTTLYNINYTDQTINIIDFSENSLNQLTNMGIITK